MTAPHGGPEGCMVIGRDKQTKWVVKIVYTEGEAVAIRDALTQAQTEKDVAYTAHTIGPEIIDSTNESNDD